MTRKSWRDRLDSYPHLPTVKPVPPLLRQRRGLAADDTIATPSPREVEAAMREVPEHCLATVFGIGEQIAAHHQATIGCTVTTAIFAHLVAHAAQEAVAAGGRPAVPWWRTLKAGGELNPKYPGGIDAQMALLEAEGHTVVQRGRRYFIEDFARKVR